MKRSTKVSLIAAVVLIVLGLGIIAAAFSAAAARLATLLQAIADAHRLNLVNLL